VVNAPEWWSWELELTSHVEKRMEDRGFTEVDLRQMLDNAQSWKPDVPAGRFVIECPFRRRKWHVIVEPDAAERLIVVITAYSTGS
jgi:hypothetical protein